MKTLNSHFGINCDTIAAVATPAGVGGVGIVRISGPIGVQIVCQLFSRSHNVPPNSHVENSSFQSHLMIHGYIWDPRADKAVDEVLMVVMKGPHSYTREDVVEIQAHGGMLLLSRILDLVIQYGARLAEPGEFTRRAFLNGRIDLSQAEAVADIINAKSAGALAVASHQLQGMLGNMVGGLREAIVQILAEVEAGIEFPDDVDGVSDVQRSELASHLEKQVINPIEQLIESFQSGRVLREGLRVVIVGRPNVGKSSLMNCLVGREKAIVTSIPGTTRDTVEDMLHIGNVEMHVSDTAGLHESTDPVEVLGMRKTMENIAIADFILMVVEAHQPIHNEDLVIIDQIEPTKTILVRNKVDLGDIDGDSLLDGHLAHFDRVTLSAKNECGIEDLKKRIAEKCLAGIGDKIGGHLVANTRHKDALVKSRFFLKQALSNLAGEGQEDVVSMDLTQAMETLGSITGARLEDEVLDSIFSNFCIGK